MPLHRSCPAWMPSLCFLYLSACHSSQEDISCSLQAPLLGPQSPRNIYISQSSYHTALYLYARFLFPSLDCEPFKKTGYMPRSPLLPLCPELCLEESRCIVNVHWVLVEQAGCLVFVGANSLPGAYGSNAGCPLCTASHGHTLGILHQWCG